MSLPRNAILTERFAIAISDLQIKVAELQRARAQLADTIREKVAVALVKFDEGRTDFQITQVVGARAIDQFKVFEYRGSNNFSGLSDDEKFLVNDYLPLIKDNPPPEVVQELLEVAKTIGYQVFSRITRELAPDILGAFIGAIVDIAIVKDGRDAFHTEIYRYPFS
ncbi:MULTISPECIES: hypothetical protein [Aphanizomenon]|uniref:hypothetical protein n=1 Tax=Aphanizomenon TaxID=1175 RepID=UPI000543E6B9|nr:MULTISPECIES: hypothetical protein [Aphanizomenon]KHG39914.1 hypothetical protein OA07_20800 [Aphanizomenon flos-aquae 2012/KM1/D3]